MENTSNFKKRFIVLAQVCVAVFALIGFAFTAVFVAMQFELLNVRGSIATRNKFFTDTSTSTGVVDTKKNETPTQQNIDTAKPAEQLFVQPCVEAEAKVCEWKQTPEWGVVKGGLEKDSAIIQRVSKETGVPARMIASVVVPEQIRFFTSNREVFKRWFEPMKILGTLTKFSLGVSGIKLETAEEIEQHAQDATSPFYPGVEYAKLIAYTDATKNTSEELFTRLTNEEDHYYSYLYTALYIKEVTAQWERAGFDIHSNPDAVVTLFNIGFEKSSPSANPVAGGAEISVGGTTYTYGELGALFYHSTELTDVFPKK